jgi:murein DD-endopeptidase MepM/ murein hydrolase activator NlpD
MPFPLPFIPRATWHKGDGHRYFGADRANGKRKHAGCDLLAPVGTEIYAVADGYVWEAVPRPFYHGTFALAIVHGSYLVRYCEVKGFAEGIKRRAPVKGGQVIAYVGKMLTMSMLHFEVYANTLNGPLTARRNKPYQRRADLVDPTALLDRLARDLLRSSNPVTLTASADGVSES